MTIGHVYYVQIERPDYRLAFVIDAFGIVDRDLVKSCLIKFLGYNKYAAARAEFFLIDQVELHPETKITIDYLPAFNRAPQEIRSQEDQCPVDELG